MECKHSLAIRNKCACMRTGVYACVRACVRACERVCVCGGGGGGVGRGKSGIMELTTENK